MIDSAVLGYYRCPEHFAEFAIPCELSGAPGYFRLGDELVCYGRSSCGQSQTVEESAQHDVLGAIRSDGSGLALPFVPADVVSNLRYERYAETAHRSFLGPLKRNIYYSIRPLLGVPVRKYLQRAELRNWKRVPFPRWPIDRTVDQLFSRVLAVTMKHHGIEAVPFVWFWPDGRNSCLVMTHDVEQDAGLKLCSGLMDLDASYGIKASFQFVPERRYTLTQDFLKTVRRQGFEVNLHDLNHDGHLYDGRELFLQRAEKINHYAREYRAHGFRAGMLYRNQSWFDAYTFSYDMSVPNVGHLDPQRGGCCTVMPYFVGPVLEIPLTTTQDYSLFHILQSYELDLWKAQVEAIIESHGLISFNVHPDYVQAGRERQTYVALLVYLAELIAGDRVYNCLPGELDQWWRARSQMRCVDEHGHLRIEGPQAERARLAWASLSGDRVVYKVSN